MKPVNLFLSTQELINDIDTQAYAMADTIKEEDIHARHQLQSICSEPNHERTQRFILTAVHECANALLELAADPVSASSASNAYREPEHYKISLTLPDNASEQTVKSLATFAHEYIVHKVIYAWVTLIYPPMAADLVQKMANAEMQLKSAAYLRRRPTKADYNL